MATATRPSPTPPKPTAKPFTPKASPVGMRVKGNPFQVRLPLEEQEYLRKLGARDNRSLAYYVQLAVIELVKRHKLAQHNVL